LLLVFIVSKETASGFLANRSIRIFSPPSFPFVNDVDNDKGDDEDADDKRSARRGGRRRKERRVFGEAYRPAIWNTADQFLRRLHTVDADTLTSFVADFKPVPNRGEKNIEENREKSRVVFANQIGENRRASYEETESSPEGCFVK